MLTNNHIQQMNITRVVYDRGVAIRLNEKGFWQFESQQINLLLIQTDNDTAKREYGLSPVMVTMELSPGVSATMLLPNGSGLSRFLDIESSEISNQLASLRHTIKLYDGFNLTYVLGAVLHHTKQIADRYCEVSANSATFPGGAKTNQVHLSGTHPEPYYEFDAWLSAAIRVYDTSRYIIWDAFRGTGSIPSSFEGVVKKTGENIPDELKQRLEQSWSTYGTRIKAYRDCIHHYSPLDFGVATAHAKALAGLIWSTQMLIPDNPEARSKSKFRFDNNTEALTFAWHGTAELVTLVSNIIAAIA